MSYIFQKPKVRNLPSSNEAISVPRRVLITTENSCIRSNEQEEMSDKMSEEYAQRRRRRQEELQQETVRTDWCYGPQKLNYVELKKARRGNFCLPSLNWLAME